MQDLYAYIFSAGLVGDCFTLVVLHPKRDLVPSDRISHDMGIVVTEVRDDSPNVYDMCAAMPVAQDTATDVSTCIMYSYTPLTFYVVCVCLA